MVRPIVTGWLTSEEEVRRHTAAKRATGRGQGAQAPQVGAQQVELDDHCVIGVVQRDDLVALVGKRRPAFGEVGANLLLTVEDVAGRHELVPRMIERGDRGVEVVTVLRLHVLAHDRLPALPKARPRTAAFAH